MFNYVFLNTLNSCCIHDLKNTEERNKHYFQIVFQDKCQCGFLIVGRNCYRRVEGERKFVKLMFT